MKLQQLFSFFKTNIDSSALDGQTDLTGLYFDTRKVSADSVFIAIKGEKSDGHDYLTEAVSKGAIALVVENKSKIPAGYTGVVFETDDSRKCLDQLASLFADSPSEKLFCFGITGTNGKTSITYILEHIFNFNQRKIGVMGTVNHRVSHKIWLSDMTTPDPVTLQSRLADFISEQATAVAMEVSSHALQQNRVDSVHFDTVVFTNLTLDHLDYHKTMQNYFLAKQKLFTDLMWSSNKPLLFAIVNTDDDYGRKLKVADKVLVWTYGQKEADFQFKILKMNYSETSFELKTPMESFKITIPVSGQHMISNCVAAMAAALSAGISIQQSIDALKNFSGVPGRLQKVLSDKSTKTVFVDYAHTPDALDNVLKALNEIRQQSNIKSRIITVFGCGGDRDKSKRPLMAEVAAKLSDFVFITSDNPRTEPADQIIEQIEMGLNKNAKNYLSVIDREIAIQKAIEFANPEDVILIAGKGHEDYQIIGTEKINFSDIEIAKKYLN